MPKKKTITVDSKTPLAAPEPEQEIKVVSIALDKNSNLYGLTEDSKVVKYDVATQKWVRS